MRAQTACEKAVAIGHMHNVCAHHACGGQAAGHELGPGFNIALGIAHHYGLAGGSA